MQLLVTGGEGSLSESLIQALIEDGHRAHVIGIGKLRHPRVLYSESLSTTPVDFRAIDAIVDLDGPAPSRPVNHKDQQRYLEQTQQLCKKAMFAGVPKYIFVSAIRPARYQHNFLSLKNEQEQLIRASGIPYLILRAPWIVGPTDLFIAPLIGTISNGQRLETGEMAEIEVQMVTQADLSQTIRSALGIRLNVSRAYDIASFESCSIQELVDTLEQLMIVSSKNKDRQLVQMPWSESTRSLLREEPIGTPTSYYIDFRHQATKLQTALLQILRQYRAR